MYMGAHNLCRMKSAGTQISDIISKLSRYYETNETVLQQLVRHAALPCVEQSADGRLVAKHH